MKVLLKMVLKDVPNSPSPLSDTLNKITIARKFTPEIRVMEL